MFVSETPSVARDDSSALTECDVAVIGAGLSGLYAAYLFDKHGYAVQGYEAGDGPGGTWYWNRYPGARVDIESMVYSYSFDSDLQQEWHWPEHFSDQKSLECYTNHVADRFNIRGKFQFGTSVDSLRFDEVTSRWQITTSRGENLAAKYVIAATGSLYASNVPDFNGARSFEKSYHTSRWPNDVADFVGERVGVIGTGSTGVQIIPIIAQTADHLYVFQRTPTYTIPAGNRPLDPAYERQYKQHYDEYRAMMKQSDGAAVLWGKYADSVFDVGPEERQRVLDKAWHAGNGFSFLRQFGDVLTNADANEVVAEFIRGKIRQTVKDPEVAEMLCPRSFPLGTKRLCLDTNYYETYNRSNVTLVDVSASPIDEITPSGLRTADAAYDLDVLVYATGFDAMTGSMTRIDIRGVSGASLREKWAGGASNYLGFAVAGFPNLFMVHGPGSPSVLAQMIMAGEWQIEWIDQLIGFMEGAGYESVEATTAAEASWASAMDTALRKTLYPLATSWYVGANIEGKARGMMIYVGGFESYADLCNEAAAHNYEGFTFT
jgi:cation diffusion facilitator CzcD-associated flavoprotein CzcO